MLSLRTQDPIPEWITHILFLGKDLKITHQGPKEVVGKQLQDEMKKMEQLAESGEAFNEIPRYYHEFGRALNEKEFCNIPPSVKKIIQNGKGFMDNANSEAGKRSAFFVSVE